MINFNSSSFPVLTTQRLTLRSLTPADAPAIRDLRSNEKVNRHLDRPKSISTEEAERFITKINEGIANNEWIYWSIVPKNDKLLLGTICLWNISKEKHQGEVGFELHPDHQGKGVMREALLEVIEYGFHRMNLSTILAFTNRENEPAIRLLKKCRFKRANEEERKVSSGEIVFYRVNKK